MTALIIIATGRCIVIVTDSLMTRHMVGAAFLHMGRAFCVPMGVAL